MLANKGGNTEDPSLFRMIALTSCLGKLKADRMAEYMTENNYIDEATQKRTS